MNYEILQPGYQDQGLFLVLYFSLWLVGTGIPYLLQALVFLLSLCMGGSFPGLGYLPHIHELIR